MLNIAVVGVGFIGEEHVEAIRRTNLGRVEALVGRDLEKTKSKAAILGIEKVYDDIRYVLEDEQIQVIHICTPNMLHYSMVKRALEAGKHVVCEKPLTLTSGEAKELVHLAEEKHLVNAIHFNIRYYPLIRHAKEMIERGDIGKLYSITGAYLQDWLVKDTDYSWRLESEKSGETRAVGDIGTHWMDLVEYITGLKITDVNADIGTFLAKRKKPKMGVETWSGKILKNDDYEIVDIDTEDYASVLLHFDGGQKGAFTVNQMACGHKNQVTFEINGSAGSILWNSEKPNELVVGRRDTGNEIIIRDPSLVYPGARSIITLPGGHNEGFADTSKQLFREVYQYILDGDYSKEKTFPVFADGYRESLLCEAIMKSQKKGQWEEIQN